MKAIKIPFSFVGGKVNTTTDRNTIEEQKIVNVLVTSNFERVHLPKYGAGALQLIYELNDPLVFFDFKTEAMFDLAENISTCTVVNMQGSTGTYYENEETVMIVDVIYQTPTGAAETANIRLAAPGQITESTPF